MVITSNPIINDLFEELEQIAKTLSQSPRRSLSNIQLSIIMKQRVDGLKVHLNNLFSTPEVSVEDKVEVYQKTIQRLLALLPYKPNTDLDLFWYQLEEMWYSLARTLMSSWGKGGFLRVLGSAQALSNILLGIELVGIEPILVDSAHPEFLSRYTLAFNLLTSGTMLFYSAATELYSLSRKQLEDWAVVAIRGNEKLLPVVEENWSIAVFYKLEIKTVRGVDFYRYSLTFDIFNEMIRYLLLLQARFGGKWPTVVKSITFLDATNTETFLNSLQSLYDKLQYYIQDFKSHVEKGTFDRNIDPLSSLPMWAVLERTKLTHFTLKGLAQIYELTIKGKRGAIDDLRAIMPEMLILLKRQKVILNNQQFLTSSLGEDFVPYLVYFPFFAGISSLHLEDLTILRELEGALGIFFSTEGIGRFPQLYGLFLTALLTTAAKLDQPELMLETAEKLIQLAPNFLFQPRDSFAFALMGHLTKLVLGQEKLAVFCNTMTEELRKITEYTDKSLVSEIEKYLKAIKKAVGGEKPSYDTRRINNPNPFDPYSLLIPDLDFFAWKSGYEKIVYLPFNLAVDYIIDSPSSADAK